LDFLGRFSKNPKLLNVIKPRPVEAEQFHVGGETDTMKLTVAARNFANAPKNEIPAHNIVDPSI
jgi:hypothetical protein